MLLGLVGLGLRKELRVRGKHDRVLVRSTSCPPEAGLGLTPTMMMFLLVEAPRSGSGCSGLSSGCLWTIWVGLCARVPELGLREGVRPDHGWVERGWVTVWAEGGVGRVGVGGEVKETRFG